MFLQSCRGDHFPFNGCSQDSDDSAVQYSSITVRNTITLFLFLKSWTVLAANGGGCSSAGRAGRLVIGRLLVQIPALATLPETRLGLSPAATPREPLKRDKRLLTMTCHDMTLLAANIWLPSWKSRTAYQRLNVTYLVIWVFIKSFLKSSTLYWFYSNWNTVHIVFIVTQYFHEHHSITNITQCPLVLTCRNAVMTLCFWTVLFFVSEPTKKH